MALSKAQQLTRALRVALEIPPMTGGQIVLNINREGEFQNAEVRMCGITDLTPAPSTANNQRGSP